MFDTQIEKKFFLYLDSIRFWENFEEKVYGQTYFKCKTQRFIS